MHHRSPQSCAVHVLTAAGRGAVAVVQLSTLTAAQAVSVLDQHFRSLSRDTPATAGVGRILYGRWHDEDLVVVRVADCVWEVHCHGGTATVAAVRDQLQETLRTLFPEYRQPATSASPPQRPLLTDVDQIEAEVQRQLIQTRTRRTARHVLAQSCGRLAEALQAVVTATSTEVMLQRVEALLQWQSFAEHLTAPWRVLVLGQPNVGKSSLVNAVVGFERSIVFDRPGTTRDIIDAATVLEDWPFLFLDTAGLRAETRDAIEQLGIRSARSALSACDACLIVVDATQPISTTELAALPIAQFAGPLAVVISKTDLIADRLVDVQARLHTLLQELTSRSVQLLPASAVTGHGIADVAGWLVAALLPHEPAPGTPLPLAGRILNELLQLQAMLPLTASPTAALAGISPAGDLPSLA